MNHTGKGIEIQSEAYALLHCHTEYSLRDSMAGVKDVFLRAKEMGAKAIAITDHGNMMAMYDAAKASKETGVRYIIGVEGYIKEENEKHRKHLILMAKDQEGYKALCKYVTETYDRVENVNAQSYPIGNKELLLKYFGKGSIGYGHVVMTSACVAGVLAAKLLANHDPEKAIEKLDDKIDSLLSVDQGEFDQTQSEYQDISDHIKAVNKKFSELKKDRKTFETLPDKIKNLKNKQDGARSMKSALGFAEKREDAEKQLEVLEKRDFDAEEKDLNEEKANLTIRKKELKSQLDKMNKTIKKVQIYQERKSEIEKTLLSEDQCLDNAKEEARWYKDHFKDFYIEVQYHGLPDEAYVYPTVAEIAHELEIPLVAANDSHMVRHTKADIEARALIRSTMFDEFEIPSETDAELYLKSDAELRAKLGEILDQKSIDEAMANVRVIADECHAEVPNELHHPKFHGENGESAKDTLNRLCKEGIEKLYPGKLWTEERQKRLDHELDVIESMGFIDYFLNLAVKIIPAATYLGYIPRKAIADAPTDVDKLVPWCKTHGYDTGLGVGPGRGSGAGSLVCELLGITKLDPLKQSLLFERFLNPERVSMPDIDTDVRKDTRQLLIGYIRQTFGDGAVCQIETTTSVAAKGAVRTAAHLYGLEKTGVGTQYYAVGDKIAKAIPDGSHVSLKDEMKNLQDQFYSPDEKKILEYASLIEGAKTGTGMHAAGVIIFDGNDLTDYIPLMRNKATDPRMTMCDMNEAEAHGLLKLDMLGLRTLDVITNTMQYVKERYGKRLTENEMMQPDPDVYNDLTEGRTDCVFQLGSDGMKSVLKDLKPGNIEDLTAVIALYRPGPMDYIPQYVKGKNAGVVEYDDPKLGPILKDTYGVIVYQEQVMQTLQVLAGYSLGQADIVRRAMSKKKQKVIDAERKSFIYGDESRGIPGCIKNGTPKEVAEKIYDKINAFASYAFNKSHAAAYARNTYMTAWLQRHYPAEYFCGLLNDRDEKLDIGTVMKSMGQFGVKLLLPDINRSFADFHVESKQTVRYGLMHIKGMPKDMAKAIVEERTKHRSYRSLVDFLKRTNCREGAASTLCDAGAFDFIEGFPGRTRIGANLAEIIKSVGQCGKITSMPHNEIANKQNELLKEHEALGVYLSGSPFDGIDLRGSTNTATLEKYAAKGNKPELSFIALVRSLKKVKTKKGGKRMGILTLEDVSGHSIPAVCFTDAYAVYHEWIEEGENRVMHFTGRPAMNKEGNPQFIIYNAGFPQTK